MDFSKYIENKFLEWQMAEGGRKTIVQFAAYLGVSQPLLSMWINGTKPKPGKENIKLLADIFGPEIYDALNLPRPDPDLHYLQGHWINLSPQERRKVREAAENYIAKRKTDK